MRGPALALIPFVYSAGCSPIAAAGVGVDAIIPELGDIDVSAGGMVWDEGGAALGAQADVPVSKRTAVTGSFGMIVEQNPSSLTRLGVRTQVTEPDTRVAVALLVSASLPTWVVQRQTDPDVAVFIPTLQVGAGGYVGAAATLPMDGWRLGLATTVGTVVSGPDGGVSPLQWQLALTWRIQVLERAYVAGEAGSFVWAGDNTSANGGVLLRIGGDISSKNRDGR